MISGRHLFAPLLGALVLLCACGKKEPPQSTPEPLDFVRLMNTGKNYMDQGQGARAVEVYQNALPLAPTDPDVHLNLANAHLLAGSAEQAVQAADEALTRSLIAQVRRSRRRHDDQQRQERCTCKNRVQHV